MASTPVVLHLSGFGEFNGVLDNPTGACLEAYSGPERIKPLNEPFALIDSLLVDHPKKQ